MEAANLRAPAHVSDGCVEVVDLIRGPQLRAIRWSCLHDGDAMSRERSFSWPALVATFHGASRLHYGRKVLHCDAASALFHPPGIPYWTSHPFGIGDHGCALLVKSEILEELATPVGLRRLLAGDPRPIPLPAKSALALRYAAIDHGQNRDDLPVQESLLIGLEGVLAVDGVERDPQVKVAASRHHVRLHHARLTRRTQGLLFETFRQGHCLEEIGRQVGASPYHLCRVFRAKTGLSIHEYRSRLRLAAALDALPRYRGRLTELALDLGFSSHGHFTLAFRNFYGKPPSASLPSLATDHALLEKIL